jgi:hypothetical protein
MGILVIIVSLIAGVGLSLVFAAVGWWPDTWMHIGMSVVVAIIGLACIEGENYWENFKLAASGFGAYGLYFLGAAAVSGVVLYFSPWSQIAIAALVVYVSVAVWWARR